MPLRAAGGQAAVVVLAGVVHQDIDPPEARQRGVQAVADLVVLADVGFVEQRPLADLVRQCLAGLGVAPTSTTLAPAAASPRAMSAPSPWVLPVTMAVLPAKPGKPEKSMNSP